MVELRRDVQERNIKVLGVLSMDRDQEYSQQKQARKRDKSTDARGKKGDVEERLKSLACLKDTSFERSIVDAPPGSTPGSSGAGVPRPPKVKMELEREVDRIEDLTQETYRVKDERAVGFLETGEPMEDHKAYHFKRTSGMAHRYRELIPKVRIPFDDCQEQQLGARRRK